MLMFSMVAGSIFILALAVYSIILWRRILLQERQRQQQRQHQQTLQKQRLKDDLIVLTGSFLTEQMPWAEGCIRIKVILDHYDAELSMQPDNQVLHEVFAATENIPTPEAWRNLSSAEKKPYQQLLNELELQHKKASTQAIKQLQQQLQD